MYPDSRILKKFLILSQPWVLPELTGKHAQKVTRHLMFSRIFRVWYAGLGLFRVVEYLCIVVKALDLIPSNRHYAEGHLRNPCRHIEMALCLCSLEDSRRKPLSNNGFPNRQGCLRNAVLLNTQAFEPCIKVFV